MKKRLQSSMGQMFVAVACLATAFRLLVLLLDTRFEGGTFPLIVYLSVIAIGGAGIGCFAEKCRHWSICDSLYYPGTEQIQCRAAGV